MKGWEGDAQAARDAAVLLPVAGAILLLPPFIFVFAAPAFVAGVPLIVVYVFGVWMSLVLGAWLVARRRAREPDSANISVDTDAVTGAPSDPDRR